MSEITPQPRWVSLTDDDPTENEIGAMDAILPMIVDIGAGAATSCGYDKKGYPLGSVTVAIVGEVVIGIAVRNAHDEHAVIVAVQEPADTPQRRARERLDELARDYEEAVSGE